MSLFGKNAYLRVTTPQTIDGTTLRYTDDDSGRVVKKETHLPLTARKELEKENELLPQHLRHKIEIVPGENDPITESAEQKEIRFLKAELLKSQQAGNKLVTELEGNDLIVDGREAEIPKRNKPGPKSKDKEKEQE